VKYIGVSAPVAKSGSRRHQNDFGSKDALFDAAFEAMVTEIIANVPPEADDLAAYAGHLFDSYERRPEVRRMAAWRRLERGDSHLPLEPIVHSNTATIRTSAAAQEAGKISDRFAPVDLLALILVIAAMWAALTPELAAEVRPHSKARRRKVVTDVVSALIVG
jgi:AcrR family transcriptional regulator